MNIQLKLAVSDITGVTGMRIIRAIVEGVRYPKTLSKMRDNRCKNTQKTIQPALEGNYQAEHIFH